MIVSDRQIEDLAAELIAQHGPHAARVAAEHLNQMIDGKDARGRDFWACVVHLIHERQSTGKRG